MIDQILAQLDGVRKLSKGYQARCPAHDDKHQSLSVDEKEDKLLLYCHAGCTYSDIIKHLTLPEEPEPVITDTYDYVDEDGKFLYQVVRYRPKTFKQRRKVNGEWVWGLNGIKPTLYGLPGVLGAISHGVTVYIVEGEKDVETLQKQGLTATTVSGGASAKWSPELIAYFKGANVAIIPDNDEPGKKYATRIANQLYDCVKSIKVLELDAKDVTDYLKDKDINNIYNIYNNTREYIPSGMVTRDEFNDFRGINRYLWNELFKVKKNGYDRVILED